MEHTIFFGNGVNLSGTNNPSWKAILHDIMGEHPFPSDRLPNTMIYDCSVLLQHKANTEVLTTEHEIKERLAAMFREIAPAPILLDLYELGAKHYITTNYDDAFLRSLQGKYDLTRSQSSRNTEDIYSVRRKTELQDETGREATLWHIHGTIEKPKSIMLGLDHYCGYVGRIGDYVKGTYTYTFERNIVKEDSIAKKLSEQSYTECSWIELFFSSHVHILGFSLDYSETDLWWLLDRRARMKRDPQLADRIKNRITFYCMEDELCVQKKQLLESFDVIVDTYPQQPQAAKDYSAFYQATIEKIRACGIKK